MQRGPFLKIIMCLGQNPGLARVSVASSPGSRKGVGGKESLVYTLSAHVRICIRSVSDTSPNSSNPAAATCTIQYCLGAGYAGTFLTHVQTVCTRLYFLESLGTRLGFQ